MTGTDHIMLYADPDFLLRTDVLPWPHQWPPWDYVILVTGVQTGVRALVSIEGLDELAEGCRELGTTMGVMYRQTTYQLCSYSELPEEVALDPKSRLFRAARYAKVIADE